MRTGRIKFKGHPCFKHSWSGFDEIKPITLIIGKNNSGKSHLLQFVRDLCELSIQEIQWDLQIESVLSKELLVEVFKERSTSAELNWIGGSDWADHGQFFERKTAVWTRERSEITSVTLVDGDFSAGGVPAQMVKTRSARVLSLLPKLKHPFYGKRFKHLLADRDIQPEPMSNSLQLLPNGFGATNIVRRFLYSTEPNYPRDIIQRDVLAGLNEVFGAEGRFREITAQHHDGKDPNIIQDRWEIFLEQEHKGLISLSNSGSGLKTVFLVLLNVIVMPVIELKSITEYIFAFEELENNLHPSLIRNLLKYIRSKACRENQNPLNRSPLIFLTTHSSVALDYFAGDENSQVIHVTHNGESATAKNIDQNSRRFEVIWDLGTRPSDLLQANGIIWVEGPSDRIYINRWIELYSEGKLKEGRHYQCAFYGGGLLANIQATLEDDEANSDLINLLKINPNAIVISDSDRKSKHAHFKARVRRIRDEFENLDPSRAFHWILDAREIENYLVPSFLESIEGLDVTGKPAPGQFESFFPKFGEKSYLEHKLGRKSIDKSKLAILATPRMSLDVLRTRFDIDSAMTKIVGIVETWNK